MSENMLDKVALAITVAEATIMRGQDRNIQSADPRALARAAIEAMREPTEEMVAAYNAADLPFVAQGYDMLIDSALSERMA